MNMYIHTYICVHVCIEICSKQIYKCKVRPYSADVLHTLIYNHTGYDNIYIYIHAYKHTYIYAHIWFTHIYIYILLAAHASLYIYLHACMQLYLLRIAY